MQYLLLGTIVLILYDYLLTFDDEVGREGANVWTFSNTLINSLQRFVTFGKAERPGVRPAMCTECKES